MMHSFTLLLPSTGESRAIIWPVWACTGKIVSQELAAGAVPLRGTLYTGGRVDCGRENDGLYVTLAFSDDFIPYYEPMDEWDMHALRVLFLKGVLLPEADEPEFLEKR